MITNYAKFQCVQDKTAMPDRFSIGETVKVYFNIKGTKWEKNGQVNYITNLDAWRMETISLQQQEEPVVNTVDNNAGEIPVPSPGDDLPF